MKGFLCYVKLQTEMNHTWHKKYKYFYSTNEYFNVHLIVLDIVRCVAYFVVSTNSDGK